MLDIELAMSENLQSNLVAQSKYGMAAHEEWEREFVTTLCDGICKYTPIRDVDSIFYIFSKNEESISQEKFKSVV